MQLCLIIPVICNLNVSNLCEEYGYINRWRWRYWIPLYLLEAITHRCNLEPQKEGNLNQTYVKYFN
jgi:hypothetical protein